MKLKEWRPNPWRLSAHQYSAISTYCEVGSRKKAANILGIAENTMKNHLENVRSRMGKTIPLRAVIEFAIWESRQ